MKTIKGSERESVGKVATKAHVMLERFLALYTEEISQYIFSTRKAFQNLVYTPNAHTVVIDLDGKSFTAILKDIQVHPVTDDILHIDFFQIFVIKKSLLKFLLKSLVTQKELWLVEIYVQP
jgi:large subunit ribosomal protein L25